MRPPICAVCSKRFDPSDGGTIRFANFEPLPERMVGHPKGLEWFCETHIDEAKSLSELSSAEAVRQIRG